MLISFAVTLLFLLLNLAALFFLWRIIFLKKSIALGLLIIIFKYPIIAYCLWKISKQPWLDVQGLLLAVCVFVLGIAVAAILRHFYVARDKKT